MVLDAPPRLRRRRGLRPDRLTFVLGGLATATVAAVMAVEVGRVWKRGSAPLPAEAEDPLQAAGQAVAETADVAVAGYREVSARENAVFNLLTAFVVTFISTRAITTVLRDRRAVGPFRSLRLGRRHIHHFVPGIVLAFGSGAIAITTRDEDVEAFLAIPFGIGMGLTLDESALLLELDDVYWSEEGLVSIQITLAVTAMLAALALAARILRRGEQIVLSEEESPGGSNGHVSLADLGGAAAAG